MKKIMITAMIVTSLGLFYLGINESWKNEVQVKEMDYQHVLYVNDPSGW